MIVVWHGAIGVTNPNFTASLLLRLLIENHDNPAWINRYFVLRYRVRRYDKGCRNTVCEEGET